MEDFSGSARRQDRDITANDRLYLLGDRPKNWIALKSLLEIEEKRSPHLPRSVENWEILHRLFRLDQGSSPGLPDTNIGSNGHTSTPPDTDSNPPANQNPGSSDTDDDKDSRDQDSKNEGSRNEHSRDEGSRDEGFKNEDSEVPEDSEPKNRLKRLAESLLSFPGTLLLAALALLIPAAFLLWNFGQPSSTGNQLEVYVDPVNGDDRNDGTLFSPVRTLAQALQQAQPGSTLYLVAGQYSPEGQEQAPLTIPENVTVVVESGSSVSFSPPVSFSDITNHWAAEFIQSLAARGVVVGFPDGTFRPDAVMTRAEYAALLVKAFDLQEAQTLRTFQDVSREFWGHDVIQRSQDKRFLVGYPDNYFFPNSSLQRIEVVAALVSGLGIQSTADHRALGFYEDWESIPSWAKDQMVAATVEQLVVNYPNPKRFNPRQSATRAEVAAILHQALVNADQAPAFQSVYIVPTYAAPQQN
jgi:hypothetical protein